MSQYDDLVNRFAELGSRIIVLEEIGKELLQALKEWDLDADGIHLGHPDELLIKKAEEILKLN